MSFSTALGNILSPLLADALAARRLTSTLGFVGVVHVFTAVVFAVLALLETGRQQMWHAVFPITDPQRMLFAALLGCVGLGLGCYFVMIPVLVSVTFGQLHLGQYLAEIQLGAAVLVLFVPTLRNLSFSLTESYLSCFFVAAVLTTLAAWSMLSIHVDNEDPLVDVVSAKEEQGDDDDDDDDNNGDDDDDEAGRGSTRSRIRRLSRVDDERGRSDSHDASGGSIKSRSRIRHSFSSSASSASPPLSSLSPPLRHSHSHHLHQSMRSPLLSSSITSPSVSSAVPTYFSPSSSSSHARAGDAEDITTDRHIDPQQSHRLMTSSRMRTQSFSTRSGQSLPTYITSTRSNHVDDDAPIFAEATTTTTAAGATATGADAAAAVTAAGPGSDRSSPHLSGSRPSTRAAQSFDSPTPQRQQHQQRH